MATADPHVTIRTAVTSSGHALDARPQGKRVGLRPAVLEDLPRFSAILTEPAVAGWWGEDSVEEIQGHLADDGDPDTVVFAAEINGEVVGLLYASEETDPGYRHASIDVTLTSAVHGQGLGRDAVATLAAWLIDARGHHRITIDPAVANDRAIACYHAVGFRDVGVMRSYERGPDGRWHDGLLMDLLADELVRPT